MSEFLEVSFYILCHNNDNDNFCMRITESIGKIPGIISVRHIHGTNIVEASGNWTESEYYKRIAEIRNVANRREVKIVKKIRHVVRKIVDNVEISEKVSWKIKTAKGFGPGQKFNEYKNS
jgi:hypothetical protein